MELISDIQRFLGSSRVSGDKNINFDSIEEVLRGISKEEVLRHMQTNIENLFYNLIVAIRGKNPVVPYLTVHGTPGSGKTDSIHQYLQQYLILIGAIEKTRKNIDKIHQLNLNEIGLEGRTADQVITEREESCKGSILILDEFYDEHPHASEIASLIRRIHSSPEYRTTMVILSGSYRNNVNFIDRYELGDLFPGEYSLNYLTPRPKEIAQLFVAHAKRKDYRVTPAAVKHLEIYFERLKKIKKMHQKLHRQGTVNYGKNKRIFGNASEIRPLFNQLIGNEPLEFGTKIIDDRHVISTECYTNMLSDYLKLGLNRK